MSDKISGRPLGVLLVPNIFQTLEGELVGRAASPAGFVPAPKWGGTPRRKFVGPNTAVVVTKSLDLPQTR